MNRIEITTKDKRFPVAENLYGLFFEDINRAGDGGLYPEMIRNRSFEDSIPPEGCTIDEDHQVFTNRGGWADIFNHGEGMKKWMENAPYTPIPGWYAHGAEMSLDASDTLHAKRLVSLKAVFLAGGSVCNIGYAGVPVKSGDSYQFLLFAKSDTDAVATVRLQGEGGVYAQTTLKLTASGAYEKYEASLNADGEDYKARLVIEMDRACTVRFGFTSLMPAETFKGHGLRKDLAEMLDRTHSKFMRFPGGCVVEGFTLETAMRFPNTIGPVWERPSHNLMWHYRTSNGLGYHEYLQLCEDLSIDALYVCNCGMSCQARVEELFEEEVVNQFLQETLDAVEYAIGPVDSPYGKLRAQAGHPEPFPLKYLEIGNENHGPAYNERYKKFYEALKARYPELIYISNSHTERDGLPTEVADEHYYNTPAFFAENVNRFDDYDRTGPEIFLGEYAVNGGETISSMECAIAEAMFLTGVERNQDIVTLTAYAPLFQNIDFTAWRPNLIVFDNHQVYGIPTYHMISMMAANRGKDVVGIKTDVEEDCPVYHGFPGVYAEKPGLLFKNAKVNGKPVEVSRAMYGGFDPAGEAYVTKVERRDHRFTGENELWTRGMEKFQMDRRRRFRGFPDFENSAYLLFGQEDLTSCTFEIDLKFDSDNSVTLSVWNYHPENDAGVDEPKDFSWNMNNVSRRIWSIKEGKGTTEAPSMRRMFTQEKAEEIPSVPLAIDYTKFNTYKIVTRPDGYDCYINDVLVQRADLKKYAAIAAVATTDEDTVYVKLVNIAPREMKIDLSLDCEVLPQGEAQVLTAPLDAVNSMDHKENVSAVTVPVRNAARCFTYTAPACSVNILRLKKA